MLIIFLPEHEPTMKRADYVRSLETIQGPQAVAERKYRDSFFQCFISSR